MTQIPVEQTHRRHGYGVDDFDSNEKYRIQNDALSLPINVDDWVEICDVEGNQPTYLFAFDEKKNSQIKATGLTTGNVSDKRLLSQIHTHPAIQHLSQKEAIDFSQLEAISLFPEYSQFGSTILFKAEKSLRIVVLALGQEMLVSEQNAPTDVIIKLRRALLKNKSKPELPKPLVKPIADIRIDHSSAQSYIVKAGQYIQIIDVEGHQCSDFQAFALSDLDNGEELGIDPTVTRTFMGLSFPAPGIHDKYYNLNSVALVEVIRDTVNRHDTFGLACNAKYYEDMGYFGHINCTDNFNSALQQHGFKPRLNWVSLNLFYNTSVDDTHAIAADVSWSRPGDYVLFKALVDLVCVSSACPDDISPSNDWNPTDIHVRIYDKGSDISAASAHRPTPQSIPIMTQETGFHPRTSTLTRNFIDYNGYWLASSYTEYGAIKEYWACREGVVMMDLSPLRKFEIYGQDAESFLQYALPRNIRRLAVGQVVYTAICYENGGMIDDGTLFRLCENNFRWICGADCTGEWLRKLAKQYNKEVWVKSSTNQLHNVAVQGPYSRDLLKKIVWNAKTQPSVSELGWFRFLIGRIGGERGIPIIVSRTGYTGELGYEVFCHPKDAAQVWQAIWQAGEEYNITPLGLDALDMLRIEAGLIFSGYEFCDQTNPFEAGISFSVPSNKEEDFVGKTSLLESKAHPKQTLVGLELHANEVAIHGDGIYSGRQQVGVITSATRSPILKKNIALCRLSVQHAELGTQLEVGKLDGLQKRIPATVVNFPFYDPEKLRVRS